MHRTLADHTCTNITLHSTVQHSTVLHPLCLASLGGLVTMALLLCAARWPATAQASTAACPAPSTRLSPAPATSTALSPASRLPLDIRRVNTNCNYNLELQTSFAKFVRSWTTLPTSLSTLLMDVYPTVSRCQRSYHKGLL